MANFYTDHPEIKFQLESNKLLERIAELKERNYADAEAFDYAPSDYADALDSYDRVCELTGDICANIIAPNAEDVDAEGPHCENGRVRYASKTYENLDATVKAGLCGVTMPRRYGGLNFPNTVYTAINEMIATADAGFENIWSLQDCIETLSMSSVTRISASVSYLACAAVRQCQWTSQSQMQVLTSRV